jgi:hypothetical protein
MDGMKARKAVPKKTTSKSAKASSRVTAATRETAAAAGAGRQRTQRQAIADASRNVGGRPRQKARGQAIQGHVAARGRRQQARRDSR